ncbi:hypothetical protein [Aurantimonas marianensis]|uniref:DUF2029 domain-containing protein n=1 Tax=Aurantimonas marianensis TaxID=2920428 RepID=A0A9X2H5Y8_9HYPH|nr:hypothetical protein [Aurantimonas marianensis]MCP3054781.1 hypothetical protein [Aurantimonas marianensis]
MSLAENIATPVDWQPVRHLGARLRTMLSPRVVRAASIAVFTLVVLATAVFALVKPEYNWDMAPYIAVSLEDRISDPVELHREAWAGIKERASEGQWYELSEGNPYNADLWQNPAHFVSQLPMYRVKIGYLQTVRWLDRVIDPVFATTLVSSLSALAVGLVLLFWMVRHGFAESGLFLVLILLLAGYFNMGMLATPDLYMAVFGLVGIYLMVKNRPWPSVPFLVAMYLVRPDGIIFLFALLLAALAFGYARLPALVAFAVAVVAYPLIAQAAGHPGWWPHFYFSNVALQNDMAGFSPAFSVIDYLRGVVRGISVALRMNNWPAIMALLLLGWVMLVLNGRAPARRAAMMLTAIVLCFLGKFVTFPLPDDRVYFMFVAAFAIILLEAWKPRLSELPPPRAASRMSQRG